MTSFPPRSCSTTFLLWAFGAAISLDVASLAVMRTAPWAVETNPLPVWLLQNLGLGAAFAVKVAVSATLLLVARGQERPLARDAVLYVGAAAGVVGVVSNVLAVVRPV